MTLPDHEVARLRAALGVTPDQIGDDREPATRTGRRATRPPRRGRSHGRIATYNVGCRCDPCREVKNAATRRHYHERQQVHRTRRALREVRRVDLTHADRDDLDQAIAILLAELRRRDGTRQAA